MKSKLIFSLYSLFIITQNFAAEDKCNLVSFINKHGIGKQYESMTMLARQSQVHPLENYNKVKKNLSSKYLTYKEEVLSHEKVLEILKKMSEEELRLTYELLYNLGNEYRVGKEEINLNIDRENLSSREQMYLDLTIKLTTDYQQKLNDLLDSVQSIKSEDIKHLRQWALMFILEDPTYSWGSIENNLLSYLSDLKYSFFGKSTGKLQYGPYYLDYVFVTPKPSLNLNLVIRPNDHQIASRGLKPINIVMSFYPFEKEESTQTEVKVCDFTLNAPHDECDIISFKDWCKK